MGTRQSLTVTFDAQTATLDWGDVKHTYRLGQLTPHFVINQFADLANQIFPTSDLVSTGREAAVSQYENDIVIALRDHNLGLTYTYDVFVVVDRNSAVVASHHNLDDAIKIALERTAP